MFSYSIPHYFLRTYLLTFSSLLITLILPIATQAQRQSIEGDIEENTNMRSVEKPNQAQIAANVARAEANLKAMKSEVAKLAELVNSLKDDLDKSNPNLLPAQRIEKVEQIRKLANRIKRLNSSF